MTPLQILREALTGPQRGRLLRLSFPRDDVPPGCLVVNRFRGFEGLSKDFRFTLELLSEDAFLRLDEFIGRLVCVSLVLPNGKLRPFTGHVAEFSRVRTDGGVAFYEAVVVPWFQFLELRHDSRLFSNMTAQMQMDEICRDYREVAAFEWRLGGAAEVEFTMAMQWDESDRNYVSRRLEAEGRHRWYEHTDQGHTLIVGADSYAVQPLDGATPQVRFHAAGGAREEDAISDWRPVRRWASGSAAVSAFDFKNPIPRREETSTPSGPKGMPRIEGGLESNRYHGHYGFRPGFGARDAAKLRIEEIEATALRFEAASNCRYMAPGRWFELIDHFEFRGGPESRFLVLGVDHDACNNYLQAVGVPSAYSNQFVCQPRGVPWRPGIGFDSQPARILAPQTARVVGPKSAGSLCVDRYGRVRLRFHWDRRESTSCWVRVSKPWAGGEKGMASHPRVGSEVIVQWLDGNPDHPVITGAVHNERYMPPWQLPHQSALTGIRSRELDGGHGGNSGGGRSNHLVLDDTEGKIQAQLRSDHRASQLSLGHIGRIHDHAGRREARGEGFELSTEAKGALRGGEGLLISTEARPNAQAHITDMPETVERLQQAQALHDHLGRAARQAGAHFCGDQDEVAATIETQVHGLKGSGGDARLGRFPEFRAPHLTLASPAGIETTTQGSTHVASVGHNAFTSGGHTSFASARSLLATARNAIRLCAMQAGMKLVAACGDIDISALANGINLLAKLDVTMTGKRLVLNATDEVRIVGGTSYVCLNAAGITLGTDGIYMQKAAAHHSVGPDNRPGPALPEPVAYEELLQHQRLAFTLRSHGGDGHVFANEPYIAYRDGAAIATGVTDGNGELIIDKHEPGVAGYSVKLSNGHEFALPVKPRLDDDDEARIARGHRH